MVAYNGYTASAKKNAAKSNQASVIKYIAAELQKCNMGDAKAMDDNLTCANKGTADTVSAAARTALAKFKNPYATGSAAVVKTYTKGADGKDAKEGFTKVTDDGSDVTILTCLTNDCTEKSADELVETVSIE